MRQAMLAGVAVGLIAVGCSSAEPPTVGGIGEIGQSDNTTEPAAEVLVIDNDMTLAEQLAAARAHWASNGPSDYDLVSERLCEDPCPSSSTRTTVLDGALMAWTPPVEGYGPAQTMEDAFMEVQILTQNDLPSEQLVQFDPTSGAVTSIVLPFDPARTDDDREQRWIVEPATAIPLTDHGAAFAAEQCPDVDWTIVGGSQFEVSVPSSMSSDDVEGVDSEVGQYSSSAFEVQWDFGEYSNDLALWQGPFTVESVNHAGIGGRLVVAEPVAGQFDGRNVTAVHFFRVDDTYADQGIWGALTLYVIYPDAANAAIADCIVRSIEFAPGA